MAKGTRTKFLIEVLDEETITIGEQRINISVDNSGFIAIKAVELQTLLNYAINKALEPVAKEIADLKLDIEKLETKVKVKLEDKIEKIIKEDVRV